VVLQRQQEHVVVSREFRADIEPENLFEFLKFKDKFGAGESTKSKRGKAIAEAEKYYYKTSGKSKMKSTKDLAEHTDVKEVKVKQSKDKDAKEPKTHKEIK